MISWLVVNEYLKSDKFGEIYHYIIEAAKRRGCSVYIVTNLQVLTMLPDLLEQERPDFVVFWDKDVRAARLLEKSNIKIFNSSEAIRLCDDKSLTYLALLNEGIDMPETILSPLTFGMEEDYRNFVDNAINRLGVPFIIKENFGSFGAQVHLAKSGEEALSIIGNMQGRDFIVQEYIENSYGRDIRINMVGDEAVATMLRCNENDFRANITNGGSMQKYTPKEEQIKMARRVCEILKLDFAGVDIMFGENDRPILCEVNSNAHFKNIYDCTGINVADHIIDYIISKVRD